MSDGNPTPNDDQLDFDPKWIAGYCMYLSFGLSGIAQVLYPHHGLIHISIILICATGATIWTVIDARQRELHLPQITHALIFFTWPISTPAIIIWTRGWTGVLFTITHAIALVGISYGLFRICVALAMRFAT